MLNKVVKVRTKLLAGFTGILLFAVFAGFSGIDGINRINHQNRIGVIVNRILGDVSEAQSAALRYIIYDDEYYYKISVKRLEDAIGDCTVASALMTSEKNIENTARLRQISAQYLGYIEKFRDLQEVKKDARASRIEEGEYLVRRLSGYLASMTRYARDPENTQPSRLPVADSAVLLQSVLDRLNGLRTTALNYVLVTEDEKRELAAESWLAELDDIEVDLALISGSGIESELLAGFEQVFFDLESYREHVISYHDLNMEQSALQARQREAASGVIIYGELVRNGVTETNEKVTRRAVVLVAATLAVAVILGILISLILSRNITIPLVRGTELARSIADDRPAAISLDLGRPDELGELAAALNKMSENLRGRQWLLAGKQGLDDELRGDLGVDKLAGKFIKYITLYIRAQLGAFYLFDGENALDYVAGYAFGGESGSRKRLEIGEGLVGQAAKDREILFFSDVEDAPAFNYGAGEKRPGYYLAAPLIFKSELIAVFLVGSFEPFSDGHKTFIESNLSNIAVLFNAAKSRAMISLLYEQAKQQQDELLIMNRELEQQADALRKSEAELQAQQEELRVTNEELEERTHAVEEQRDSIRLKNEELLRAQAEIQKKAADLEQASRYKSEFLANMSHELRTPLNSILILSQLMAANRDGNLSGKQIKSAEAVHSAGADLLKLINEILDLSRIEAGKIEINIERVELAGLEAELERIFGAAAEEKGISLDFSMSSGSASHIMTDGHRLQQILRNLLTNAVKFTDQGGVKFDIRGGSGRWKNYREDEYVVFSVKDSGIGIPENKQQAVFEAFQQADGSTVRKYGGTGLGLSISRDLAELLGGEITLDSREGEGSTFSLYLPFGISDKGAHTESPGGASGGASGAETAVSHDVAERAAEAAGKADDHDDITPEDRSILVIEDDPDFIDVLIELVRERGFKVLAARDGETGLHYADYYRPSAIILDIGLPGIDGWTVMERLKSNPELRHIPVHFMSGQEELLDAMKMGAVGYLTKPVSIGDINAALNRIERIVSTDVRQLLVVEDDELQRESIKELIGNGDVEIAAVSTGSEAYELLLKGCFDCMILDLGLSDMSGFELLEKIQNETQCGGIPVIIYTARDLTKEEEQKLNSYADSIIIKGVKSPERLLDETSLFLHRVESNLPEDKRRMLRQIHSSESALEGKNILLVDDDMRNIFALSNILEEKGVNIIAARDGLEALEKLEQEPEADLVLMDIMMPRMDGYETMREIRKDPRFRKLPIIALTAKAMKDDRNKCIEAGASEYLVKPVDTEKLLSMLRVWLYE